jgi:hypothetical protein
MVATLASLAAALTLAGSGSGCALGSGNGITAEAARTSLYATLDETQDRLGGQWDNQDDPTPRGCSVALWSEGEMYPALRVGTPPERPEYAVESVSAYWDGLGLVLSTTDVGDVVELQGESDEGEIVILRVSAEAMTLQGESECRPEA